MLPTRPAKDCIEVNRCNAQIDDNGPAILLMVKLTDENGEIFHTYSTYTRGAESTVGAYSYRDLVPGSPSRSVR
jgi:predicted dithiol-disulfide oxidoreductase (DUF899 family)